MAAFEETHPIAFHFLGNKGVTPVLFIADPTLVDAEDDTEDPQSLTLRLTNVSSRPVELADPATVGKGGAHFTLLFRPATLSSQAMKTLRISPRTWSFKKRTGLDGTIALDLLNSKPPLLPPGEGIDIKLTNVSADSREGARHTSVELRYGKIRFQGDTGFLPGSRSQRLQILNPPTNRKLPLHIGFAGGNRVLNDGLTENTLRIGFTNILKEETVRFVPDSLPAPTRITVSFDIAPGAGANMDWAIGTEENMASVEVTPVGETDWRVIEPDDQSEDRVWQLTPEVDMTLPPGGNFQFVIDLIRSSLPTGPANLYLNFENVPGFLDQETVLSIEKSPLIYAGLNVGIGLIPPVTALPESDLPDGQIPPPPVAGTGNLLLHGSLFDSLSGGGTVTWKDNRLSWTEPLVAFKNHPIPSPGGGVALTAGDSLYAELGKQTALKKHAAGDADPILSNWVLIAEVNAQNRLRLSNGVTLPPKGQSTDGSPVLRGTVIMWSGAAADIPDGWVVCNGTPLADAFPTPDLRGQFIVGHDPEKADYILGANSIGKEKVQLLPDQMPKHGHGGTTSFEGSHTHSFTGIVTTTGGKDLSARPIVSSNDLVTDTHPRSINTSGGVDHNHTIPNDGSDQPHENRPPYYVLVFLMKV